MDSKEELVVFVGTHPIGLRYMPQKAIGSALKLQAIPHQKNTRRISFTTPPDRRAALVEQAKALYSEFQGALDNRTILDFVSARLSSAPEESDVVHDLLAHLAERMIEMNKEKNAEIKSFLDFLKGEIGVSVEYLSNKTAIQEYGSVPNLLKTYNNFEQLY